MLEYQAEKNIIMLKTSNKRGGVGCGLTKIPTIIIEEGDENLDNNATPNLVKTQI
jgi:hypothetical protein